MTETAACGSLSCVEGCGRCTPDLSSCSSCKRCLHMMVTSHASSVTAMSSSKPFGPIVFQSHAPCLLRQNQGLPSPGPVSGLQCWPHTRTARPARRARTTRKESRPLVAPSGLHRFQWCESGHRRSTEWSASTLLAHLGLVSVAALL